ncbi:MAG: hypothetical protein WCL06_03955 [Bacteroidota bacterium]
MKKLKIAALLLIITVVFACGTKKGRYEKCSHFSQKAMKTEQLHASI